MGWFKDSIFGKELPEKVPENLKEQDAQEIIDEVTTEERKRIMEKLPEGVKIYDFKNDNHQN